MQWQPTIQAWFCIQIKAFNYTQRFDKMTPTSRSVVARAETRREMRMFIANFEASAWMSNQVHATWRLSRHQEATAVLFPTHLHLQCWEQLGVWYVNDISCVRIYIYVALRIYHQRLTHKWLQKQRVSLRGHFFTSFMMWWLSMYEIQHVCSLSVTVQ